MLIARARPAAARGFTIVEILVVLGVSSILMAIAVPTMRSFIENSRIRAASESLQSGISLARNEAVRRNERIEFAVLANGWEVRVPGAADPLHAASGREGSNGLTLTIGPGGADRLTYDAFGRVTANADTSAPMTLIDIASTNPPSSSNYRPLRVQITATGTPRLCNPYVGLGNPAVCL